MADLTPMQINDAAPGAPFAYDADADIYYMDLSVLLGRTDLDLTQPIISEVIVALLENCIAAQTAYNADPSNPKDLRSFLAPTASAPTKDADGKYRSTFTYTVSVRRPLVEGTIDSVEV
ncbi:MAG TPA: hypothetical protein V6C65_35590 [Allocoleopsis sp.]